MLHFGWRFRIRVPRREGKDFFEYADLFGTPLLEDPDAAFSRKDLDPSTPTKAEARGAGRRKARRLALQYRMHPCALIKGVFEGFFQGRKEAAGRGGSHE
jgi:hypothetical protein